MINYGKINLDLLDIPSNNWCKLFWQSCDRVANKFFNMMELIIDGGIDIHPSLAYPYIMEKELVGIEQYE